MRTLTVRLPETLVADIEAESRTRKVSKSDIMRSRLSEPHPLPADAGASTLDRIRDLVGTVEGLPRDLSARKKHYLRVRGYGENRDRRQRVSRRAAQSQ